jgi:hypothetical protein
MKKDDAMALRERLAGAGAQAAAKAGFEGLADDGKLSHDEVGEVARWALRMSLPGRWPHRPDAPGLRFEAWFFQGKPKPDEEVLLLAVARADGPAEAFTELVEGGKYARRYKPLEALVQRFYPDAIGISRRAPVAKAEAAWTQLVADALKPLDAAIAARGPGAEQVEAIDPMEALRKKFGGG